MDHQDWEPVSWSKKKETTEKKANVVRDTSVKLDENDEVMAIKYVPRETSILLTNARVSNKLTRKELANKLNLKEDVITNIENGTAIYNGNQIAKIKKCLGVK
jgi:ribosome-binding protein aMBF1 (putative translation factor)